MRSLFWTVLLIFWAGALIIIAGTIFVTSSLQPESTAWFKPKDSIETIADQAIVQYETKKLSGLNRYANQLHTAQQLSIWLIDADGKSLHQPIPLHIAQQITSFPQTIKPSNNKAGPFYIQTINRSAVSGESFRLIVSYNEKNRPGNAAPHLIRRYIIVLVAILMGSLLIAWTLTRPIRKLQLTTQAFAAGNLQARAPKLIVQRRDSIGDLGREFNHMAQRVDKLLTSQTRLLRDVSHELRTPLARIQVALALAEQRSSGGENEHKRIETELKKLDNLISQILKLSRLEAETDTLVLSTFQLESLLDKIITDVKFEFNKQQKNIQLIANEDSTISADYYALSSALENVIRNAMRYTADSTEVEVTIQSVNKSLQIEVRDQGMGVDESELDKLFIPFYRTSEAREAASGGKGIGLAITQHIIHRHQGEIVAENHHPKGLTIRIRLPREPQEMVI